MRVLLVSQDFPPAIGGIQTYAWELTNRLSQRTESLFVLAPQADNAETVDQETAARVTRLPVRPDLLLFPALAYLPVRARQWKPHVAFHTQWQTVGASMVARALTGWPRHIVCAAHGRELLFNPADDIPFLQSGYERVRRLVLNFVDLFVPVSHYTGGLLHDLGVASNRIQIVPNGTDPEHFAPRDGSSLRADLGCADGRMLLTVGRLVPRKGIDTVLRALPRILDTVPDLTYVVVGTGPDRGRLEDLAVSCGVRAHVQFLGSVPYAELPVYYSAADVFVMPAREARPDVEGFGIVFLEANACETPVVGARTGGIPDAIDHETTGLLVPPSSPDDVADAIERLLTHPEFAADLGRNGRARVLETASWDRVADRLFEHLSTVG